MLTFLYEINNSMITIELEYFSIILNPEIIWKVFAKKFKKLGIYIYIYRSENNFLGPSR